MRMTGRVKEIVEMNTTNQYIPLVSTGRHGVCIFPMYFATIMDEHILVMPATAGTDIDKALASSTPALALVADRAGGYEAYVLEGKARYVTDKLGFQLVAAMQNAVPGFPVHGAVVFDVREVHLAPPP